jgi:hypothetical protein
MSEVTTAAVSGVRFRSGGCDLASRICTRYLTHDNLEADVRPNTYARCAHRSQRSSARGQSLDEGTRCGTPLMRRREPQNGATVERCGGGSQQPSQANPGVDTSADVPGRSLAGQTAASVRTRPAALPQVGASAPLGQVRIIDIEWSSVAGVAGLQLAGRLAGVLVEGDQALDRAAG